MQYANRSGNCVRMTSKLPCGRRNLKRMRGSAKTLGLVPMVWTLTQKGWMARTTTRRLLVNPSFLFKFRITMQISPTARSEERRVGKEGVIRVDIGGRRNIK